MLVKTNDSTVLVRVINLVIEPINGFKQKQNCVYIFHGASCYIVFVYCYIIFLPQIV